LIEHLRRNGCEIEREGSRHSIYLNPANKAKAPVPRHTEIDSRLVIKICRQLGVPSILR
jgi:mRNA interferase HicA